MNTSPSPPPSTLEALGQLLYGITFTALCIAGGIALVLALNRLLPAIWRQVRWMNKEGEAPSPLATGVILVGLAVAMGVGVVLIVKGLRAEKTPLRKGGA